MRIKSTLIFAMMIWTATADLSWGQTLPPPKAAVKEAAIELETWESTDKQISLAYPKSWKVDEKPQGALFFAVGTDDVQAGGRPDTIAFRSSAGAPQIGPKFNMDQFGKGLKKSTGDRVKEFRLISENTGMIAGAQGVRLVYDGKDEGGMRARNVEWVIIKGANTYTLSIAYDPARQEKMQPVVLAVTRSLSFGGKRAATAPVAKTGVVESAVPALPADAVAFESKAQRFRLSYPKSWTPHPVADPATLLFLLPERSAAARPRSIVVAVEPIEAGAKAIMLSDQVAGAVASMKSVVAADAKVLESADLKVSGEKAHRAVLGGHGKDQTEMRGLYLVFQRDNAFISITGRSTLADFDSLKESFDQIVSSLELMTAAPKKAQ